MSLLELQSRPAGSHRGLPIIFLDRDDPRTRAQPCRQGARILREAVQRRGPSASSSKTALRGPDPNRQVGTMVRADRLIRSMACIATVSRKRNERLRVESPSCGCVFRRAYRPFAKSGLLRPRPLPATSSPSSGSGQSIAQRPSHGDLCHAEDTSAADLSPPRKCSTR